MWKTNKHIMYSHSQYVRCVIGFWPVFKQFLNCIIGVDTCLAVLFAVSQEPLELHGINRDLLLHPECWLLSLGSPAAHCTGRARHSPSLEIHKPHWVRPGTHQYVYRADTDLSRWWDQISRDPLQMTPLSMSPLTSSEILVCKAQKSWALLCRAWVEPSPSFSSGAHRKSHVRDISPVPRACMGADRLVGVDHLTPTHDLRWSSHGCESMIPVDFFLYMSKQLYLFSSTVLWAGTEPWDTGS